MMGKLLEQDLEPLVVKLLHLPPPLHLLRGSMPLLIVFFILVLGVPLPLSLALELEAVRV